MATSRQARKAARVFNEPVVIPASDADSGSEEEDEEESPAVGAAASDDDEDDEEGEAWETDSFFRDALGDGTTPVVFEPREWGPSRVAG